MSKPRREWKEMEERKHEREEGKTETAGDPVEVRNGMVGLAQKGAAEMEMDSALAMGKGRAGDTERSEEA